MVEFDANQMAFSSDDYPPVEWLKSRMTAKEIEQVIPNYRDQDVISMFGQRWQEGDEVWRFSSPAEQWAALAGRGGIALVRRGRPVAYVITVLS